jgi:hypothetical protein
MLCPHVSNRRRKYAWVGRIAANTASYCAIFSASQVFPRKTLGSADVTLQLPLANKFPLSTREVLLSASQGELLTKSEQKLFKELAGRSKCPTKPVKRLILRIGRRGAKTTAGAVLCIYEAFCRSWAQVLRAGELGTVLYLAKDQKQAGISFARFCGIVDEIPAFRKQITRRTSDTLELGKLNIQITVRPSIGASIRGLTVICCFIDEAAHLNEDENLQNPLKELVRAIPPGLMTTNSFSSFIDTLARGWRVLLPIPKIPRQ